MVGLRWKKLKNIYRYSWRCTQVLFFIPNLSFFTRFVSLTRFALWFAVYWAFSKLHVPLSWSIMHYCPCQISKSCLSTVGSNFLLVSSWVISFYWIWYMGMVISGWTRLRLPVTSMPLTTQKRSLLWLTCGSSFRLHINYKNVKWYFVQSNLNVF